MLETCTSEISFPGGNPQWVSDYMHARYYRPYLGRFLSVDPIGGDPSEPQGWNRYAYVQNNPMNFIDPFGLMSCESSGSGVKCEDAITVGDSPVYPQGAQTGLGEFEGPGVGGLVRGRFQSPLQATAGAFGLQLARFATWLTSENEPGCFVLDGEEVCLDVDLGMMVVGPGASPVITFGHGSRHLAGSGLAREAVESAIEAQVNSLAGTANATGYFWGHVTVGGRTVQYRAHTWAPGRISVGTYYLPKR